jgi:mRNA interferase RelE/StbE
MNKQRKKYYQIKWKNSVVKSIKVIAKNEKKHIIKEIEKLQKNPLLGKKLQGDYEEFRRIRIGNYRVLYFADFQKISIIILKISHRKDAYR